MKAFEYKVLRYDAEEGKVFDWVDLEAHQTEDEEGNAITNHLYAKTIFLGNNDSIANYIEVVKPEEE